MAGRPLLAEFELTSPGVQSILEEMDKRMELHKNALTSMQLSEKDRDILCGRVAELKAFKKLLFPPKLPVGDQPRDAMSWRQRSDTKEEEF